MIGDASVRPGSGRRRHNRSAPIGWHLQALRPGDEPGHFFFNPLSPFISAITRRAEQVAIVFEEIHVGQRGCA